MFNKKYIIVYIFLIIVLFSIINPIIQKKIEYKKYYKFIITKIELTTTNSLVFYDEKKEIYLWNYNLREDQGIKVGDLLYKKANSNYIYFYRKDKNGKYYLYLKEKSQ
jgi:hypothetical protein